MLAKINEVYSVAGAMFILQRDGEVIVRDPDLLKLVKKELWELEIHYITFRSGGIQETWEIFISESKPLYKGVCKSVSNIGGMEGMGGEKLSDLDRVLECIDSGKLDKVLNISGIVLGFVLAAYTVGRMFI